MPEDRAPAREDGTLSVLHAMLTTFTEVLDGMDRRLSSMEETLGSLRSDQEQAQELRQALTSLGRVEGIEEDLAEMRVAVESLRSDQDQAQELRQALTSLGRVEGIEKDLAELRVAVQSLRSDQDQAQELRQALTSLGRVEWIEEDLAEMRVAVQSLRSDQDQAQELRRALTSLGRVEGIEENLTEMRAALLDHPATTVYDAVVRLTGQVDALVAQPGPGPAMAMVAAGLSERFEQRTESVVLLLEEHAELMHTLTNEVREAMQGLVVAVEGRQASLDSLVDTVRAVARTIDGMGARIEEARDRLDAVFGAGEDLPAAVESLHVLEEALRETAEIIQDRSVAGLKKVVREEAELLGQRLAAVAVSVDGLGRLLARHTEETTHSLGRKASEAGRRLVADLGLSAKPKNKTATPPPPPPLPPPPLRAEPFPQPPQKEEAPSPRAAPRRRRKQPPPATRKPPPRPAR